jgi:hypothetical protein
LLGAKTSRRAFSSAPTPKEKEDDYTEDRILEQLKVLFPRNDEVASADPQEWSPQAPYKDMDRVRAKPKESDLDDWDEDDEDVPTINAHVAADAVSETPTPNASEQEDTLGSLMDDLPEEYGFFYKGPEPTRFGDWNHKGRTTDF